MKSLFFVILGLILFTGCSGHGVKNSTQLEWEKYKGQVRKILMNTENLNRVNVVKEVI